MTPAVSAADSAVVAVSYTASEAEKRFEKRDIREFHFLTTEDDPLAGPAYTHLTLYGEAVNGVPRVAIQDGRNIDEAKVGKDIVGMSEHRAVAGANGDSDGYGGCDCYLSGTVHRNGKVGKAGKKYFDDAPGPFDKLSWHHVKTAFRLNSVRNVIGRRDGGIQFWFDGTCILVSLPELSG